MEDLIKILESESAGLIDAQMVHQFLRSKQDYTAWIKQRIDKYGYKSSKDYLRFYVPPVKRG